MSEEEKIERQIVRSMEDVEVLAVGTKVRLTPQARKRFKEKYAETPALNNLLGFCFFISGRTAGLFGDRSYWIGQLSIWLDRDDLEIAEGD